MLNVLTKKSDDKKKKKGFTLVELIIVLAIIAILAAISIPKFLNVMNNAKYKADLANAKSIESAITIKLASGKLDLPATGTKNITIADVLNTVPVGKGATGAFTATLSSDGTIVVKIGDVVVLGDGQDSNYSNLE